MATYEDLATRAVATFFRINSGSLWPVTVSDILNLDLTTLQLEHWPDRLRVLYLAVRELTPDGRSIVNYPVEVYFFSGGLNGKTNHYQITTA